MRKILTAFVFLTLTLVVLPTRGYSQDPGKWELVYENDASGNRVSGDISALISAVRNGMEVRVGWESERRGEKPLWVEHIAEASFLTIMSGEIVFAQIHGILGQTPDFSKEELLLKENLNWTLMAATNGKSDAIMRDMTTSEITGHNQRARGFKWWVSR